ncbi:hypothetical protein MIND_00563900 [Mycena indigotica]|uniref:F-box domain-containing protein n=1 Tax=Mycena indigotica TaxID=2126181 RepID=A0A8H6W596_9AGAR|nr:uncharacterized protein MIND_00563900 [Mycena indigotica]KAF7303361.1 hypothetical protein MIND_00563900 [Mycena indigotica]
MGQNWKLKNFSKHCDAYTDPLKLGEILFWGHPGGKLLSYLRKVHLPPLDVCVGPYTPGQYVKVGTTRRRLPKRNARETATGIVALPLELLDLIFGFVDDLIDALVLGMTCQLLWDVGRRQVYALLCADEGLLMCSWAGDRLAVVGEYTELNELPEYFFPNGLAKYEEGALDVQYCMDFWDLLNIESRVRLPLLDRVGFRGDALWLFHHGPGMLTNVAVQFDPPFQPRTAVLRNLTTCQYVRQAALEEMQARYRESEELRAPFYTKASVLLWETHLGDLLYCQICWSLDPSVSMRYEKIHQGPWAGHRFDIVGAEWLEQTEKEGWVDASEETVDELEAIWRSEYAYVGED